MKSIILILILITLNPATSHAGAWGPIGSTSIYTYINDEREILEVSYGPFGERTSEYIETWGAVIFETMVQDESGDVFLSYSSLYYQGAIDPEYGYGYDPGLLFLDYPLAVGKSWVGIGDGTGFYYPTCFAIFEFEVVSELNVTVPAGTFSVFEVTCVNSSNCLVYPETGSYFLSPEYGPIIIPGGYQLASINGSVSVEESTWGGIKALYR